MDYIAILCGGDGSRLWPVSRMARPKQFLDLMGCGRTLLQLTAERAEGVVDPTHVYAVTTAVYEDLVREQLPDLPAENLLVEPSKRNTAPAVLMALRKIAARNPKGVIAMLPSDHIVMRQREFSRVIEAGFRFVRENRKILCIATAPKSASIAHRYIQEGAPTDIPGIHHVAAFTGKPDSEMARIFYESGEFLWNTGILIFPVEVMEAAYRKLAPDLWELSEVGLKMYRTPAKQETLEKIYARSRSVTVDDAILENLEEVYVYKADIGWSDLGSWNALYEMSPKTAEGNVTQNTLVYSQDCRDTLFITDRDKLILASGLRDYIVADSGNSLMICPRGEEKALRAMVKSLKTLYGEKYL